MTKKKYQFQISLYILVPFISSGIALIWVLLTGQVITSTHASKSTTWFFALWETAAFIITYLMSLLITWLILNPVSKFIKKAESLPVYPASPAEKENPQPADAIAHYSQVFEQITSILSKVEAKELFPGIIGQCALMRGIFSQILKVARTDSTVLISGESGTGKELVATSLFEHSFRRDKPFIKLNCVAIPEGLLESELFGHEKGAFTGALARKRGRFERAHGGTIFLDEISELPPHAQVRLLRVLQEKEIERVGGTEPVKVDIRIISATNRNLEKMVEEGDFRGDLYFRIKVFPIDVPPLRARKNDIPALVQHFTRKKSREMVRHTVPTLAPGAIDALMTYDWPGNVREVENAVERALILSDDKPLKFDGILGVTGATRDRVSLVSDVGPGPIALHDIEADHIRRILKTAGGRIEGPGGAAELLGMNPGTLRHRMRKLGIPFGRKSRAPDDGRQ